MANISIHNGNEKEEEINQIRLFLPLRIIPIKTPNLTRNKLLVLDLNGLLIHRAHKCNNSQIPPNRNPDSIYGLRLVYKRPFLEEFIKFCLERFHVGIWSSAKESNVDGILECAFKGLKSSFLFVWDQKSCSNLGFKSLDNKHKPLFFKELKKVWEVCASRGGLIFSESNTLLIDDAPYKALLNPANTGIFPKKYDAENQNDDFLDPKKSGLCRYLEGLADAEEVPRYVEQHPFLYGQAAIDNKHPNWDYYSSILLQHSRISPHSFM